MKIVLRIAAILAVALVVVGAAVAVTSFSGSGSAGSGQAQGITQQVRFNAGGPRPEGLDGGRDGGQSGWSGLLKNLVSVGWVAAAVVVAMRGWKMLQGASRRNRLGPTPTT